MVSNFNPSCKTNPCYKCAKRHQGCHISCAEGIAYEKKLREYNQQRSQAMKNEKHLTYLDMRRAYCKNI